MNKKQIIFLECKNCSNVVAVENAPIGVENLMALKTDDNTKKSDYLCEACSPKAEENISGPKEVPATDTPAEMISPDVPPDVVDNTPTAEV